MSVPIAMIAAVARNGVIGADGGIPWRIPSDLAFFKRMTLGKPIVMGRKQYETVGRPLPGRTNIVVTRQAGYQPDGVIVVNDLDAALALAQRIAVADGASEVMIVGGGEIYRQAMPQAERLYISHVDLSPEGEITFPPIMADTWKAETVLDVPSDPRDAASFRAVLYTRMAGAKR
ncbi:dihydrofolate reductase [Devosia enhydra]|uniref:Dihydrofolate reductase n=1 Tax=Devosia enhydra TaxID=665118 RepID=A0A1K2HVY0_9HYPH|nr:dihydrofolate reductase [Devosia enhydra]SFZ82807.1 dihydrofolate reductase [Devosia enhydra]